MENILVIAPHPDDEVLGCGATIKKKILEGHNVYVLIMTNAHVGAPDLYTQADIDNDRECAVNAHNLLGIKDTFFLDFPAPVLDQFPAYKISRSISDVLYKYDIGTVYIPHRGDIHKDHKMVFDAAMVACRPLLNQTVKSVLAYETLSETEWGNPISSDVFIPTVFESVEVDIFKYKLNAMKCYKNELKSFPSSRSIEAIEALAKYRGATISEKYAEAFMLIRKIN